MGGDNAAGAVCGAATVCNYAGGDQAGVAGGDVCLPHTKLLGTIADTAPWTAAAQKKLDGVANKFCLATDGTTFSSKECATTEKCNPHASSTADVCKKGTTVLNHGDIAPEAADPVADSQVVCIGKSFWKNCASTNGDVKEVCNEGAAALTDVCILTTDCANAEEPLKAFREAGVEAAEDQKWCFATDGAAKCGLDTLCNPSGVDGGTGSAAICADATKRVPHGEAATEELIHCYGDSGNSALATDESEDGWLCDEGKGKFHDPKTKMEPRSKNETPDPVPEGEKAVEVCFGKDKVETCDVGVYCNSMGTETGCSDADCTSKNICITEESIIAEGEQWVEDGKKVCLNADATQLNLIMDPAPRDTSGEHMPALRGSFLESKNPFTIAGDRNPQPAPVVNVNLDEPQFGTLDEEIWAEREKVDEILLDALERKILENGEASRKVIASNSEKIAQLTA